MAVAEAVRHSSRGQRTATAEATHDAPRSQFAFDVARRTELFQLYEDEINGVRPPRGLRALGAHGAGPRRPSAADVG